MLNNTYALASSLALLLLLLCTSHSALGQTIIYVDDDATGLEDGSSWIHAFTSLQDARNHALTSGGGEIWVATGTYYPDDGLSQTIGDRSTSFLLTNSISYLGGFTGNEVSADQRDWILNETILSGDIGTSGDASDNSFHVTSGGTVDSTAIIDGFIIEHGNADDTGNDEIGGGMLLLAGSPVIRNVVFRFNESGESGGALYVTRESNPTIEGSTFSENEARVGFGGAIYIAPNTSVHISNSEFLYNDSHHDGGAIFIDHPSNEDQARLVIDKSYFEGNEAFLKSGGATPSGGAISNDRGLLTVRNSTFINNSSQLVGGAIYEGYNFNGSLEESRSWYINNVFIGNESSTGGGLYTFNSASIILNSTFYGNNSLNDGGGIFVGCQNCVNDPLITNTLLSGNTATQNGDEIYSSASSDLVLTNTLIQKVIDINFVDGGGNITGSPIFYDADGPDNILGTRDDEVSLAPNSLGIDMGLNDALDLNTNGNFFDDVPTDIDGFIRIYDSNADGEKRVDIGAYEAPLPPPTNVGLEAGDSEIEVVWTGVSGVAIAGYAVYRGTEPEPTETIATTDSTSYLDTGLTNYVDYYYRLVAVDSDGIAGRFSEEVSARPIDLTPPLVPTGFEAIAGDSVVSLIWNSNEEGDLLGYLIVGDTIPEPTQIVSEVNAGQNTLDHVGLTNNILYYYRIAAADTAFNVSEYSEVITATPIGSAFLQFVHNAPDVPSLVTSVSGEQIVDSLAYMNATDFIELRSVDVDLVVTYEQEDGSTETVLDSTITLVDENTYVFVANGTLADDSFKLVLNDKARYKATTPEAVDFFVFHGSPDALMLEVNLLDASPDHNQISVLSSSLDVGDFTSYRSITADVFNVELVSSLTGQPIDIYGLDFSNLHGSSVTVLIGGYREPVDDQKPFGVHIFAEDIESVNAPVTTSLDEESELPAKVRVHGAYPNPFRSRATLLFDLPSSSEVSVELFDVLGRKVFVSDSFALGAGKQHTIPVDGASIGSGVYMYRLLIQSGNESRVISGRMVKVD